MLVVLLQKPYDVGDGYVVGSSEATRYSIGIRSVRLGRAWARRASLFFPIFPFFPLFSLFSLFSLFFFPVALEVRRGG